MKFTVQGDTYEIPDPEDMSTKELRDIKAHTGLGMRGLGEALQDMEPDALVALVYLAKRRAGEKVAWGDFDDLRPFKDIEWPDGGESDSDSDEAEQPPPTRRSRSTGSTRTGGSTGT